MASREGQTDVNEPPGEGREKIVSRRASLDE